MRFAWEDRQRGGETKKSGVEEMVMEHRKPSIEAPTFWGDETPRPRCPNCLMNMILVSAVQADRRYECLRCGPSDDAIERKR